MKAVVCFSGEKSSADGDDGQVVICIKIRHFILELT
jgi:hypothetical protein